MLFSMLLLILFKSFLEFKSVSQVLSLMLAFAEIFIEILFLLVSIFVCDSIIYDEICPDAHFVVIIVFSILSNIKE